MKKSIEKKYALIFSLLVATVIFICWCANVILLSRYSVSKRLSNIKKMYEQLDAASSEYGIDSKQFREIFESNTMKLNCDVLVLDQDMNVIISNVMDENKTVEELLSYFFAGANSDEQPPRIIEKSDKYTMQLATNFEEDSEYLELWGVMSTGTPIVIKSAVSGIYDSAKIANVLLAYIGIIVALLSIILCRIVARTFSKNAELQLELKKREEMDEMRKEFLSNVSHELKTPIALIQGYAEGLIDCVNDDEESKNFYCEVIVDETNKMNKLVKNLLELNELEFGQNNITIERFDIKELIKNCITAFDMTIKQNGIRVEFDCSEPVFVKSDEFKIEQVFNNYFSNAINHIGGEDKLIRIKIDESVSPKVRVSVYNSGITIPEEALPHIWDKFYKVDKARTRAYGGSGVGLSIVKASLEALNQKYGVVNYTDGVEFYFEVDSDNTK